MKSSEFSTLSIISGVTASTRNSPVETEPFKARWERVFISTTYSAPFRHQQRELWVRWHVQKPHHYHQPPEVIQSPGPLCVCVRCQSQVSNPRPPSAGCSHWIIQERLNALCSELTGTKPHLGRINHHRARNKSALIAWKCCCMVGIVEQLILMLGIFFLVCVSKR